MNNEKLKEIFSDEEFVKSLFALETAAEVQTALKEKGVEMTEEEILAVRDLLLKVEKGEVTPEQLENEELPEELLEQVAGGFALHIVIGVVGVILLAAIITDELTDGKW